MNASKAVAEKLLQIKAIKLNLNEPFTWASGWKSPIYCDNRKSLSHPHIREFIKSELSNRIMDDFPEAEVLAGVATAGIPWGAMVADQIKLPFIYVRSTPKAHGLGNQIEGEMPAGSKVVVIEDLISTGKSSLQVVDALRQEGANVLGMAAIFTYGFPEADAQFSAANVPLSTLSNYSSLIELAVEKNMFSESEQGTLNEWRTSPSTWKQG
jgi:orotate phosphoribosyltransferase